MKIPRFRLTITDEYSQSLRVGLQRGELAVGDGVHRFETALSGVTGYKFNISTSNGFSALHLALETLIKETKKTDILMPACSTCYSVVNAILAAGKKIKFYDVNSQFDVDLKSLEKAYDTKTAGIVVISHFGNLSNADHTIRNLIDSPIIEDCSQSILSKHFFKDFSSPDCSTFSFYPTKGVSAIDGGAIGINDLETKNRIKEKLYYKDQTRLDGINRYNYKMNNINALFGLVSINNLEKNIDKRLRIKKRFDSVFTDAINKAKPLHFNATINIIPQKYVVVFQSAELAKKFLSKMKDSEIAVSKEIICFVRENQYKHYKNAFSFSNQLLSIPFYEGLTELELQYIEEKSSLALQEI